jgi:trimeric autotransporter adhesin
MRHDHGAGQHRHDALPIPAVHPARRRSWRASVMAVAAVAAVASCDQRGELITAAPAGPAYSTIPTQNTSPLEVRMTSPSNGATVSGTVTIEVRVREQDGARHARTDVFIGSQLVASSTSDRIRYSWNTAGFAGSQTLTGVGWDTQGRSALASITVTVPGATGGEEPPPAPLVSSLTIAPDTITAGDAATGTVVLDRPAPAEGTAVSVASNNTAVATVVSTVTVAAGATTATFAITGRPVAQPDWAAITATTGTGASDAGTAVVWVLPAGVTLESMTMSPTLLVGGETSEGIVTLTGPAPAGGAQVALFSSDPTRATVPPDVMVPAGQTTATFVATAQPVASPVAVTINASYGGVTHFVRLTIDRSPEGGGQLASLTIEPDIVVGGQPAQGTVTLGAAADADTDVELASTDPSVATVPASVTVPAGATSATFTVTTLPNNTGTGQFAWISGEAGGVSRGASITTTAAPSGPVARRLDIFPARLGGRGPATGVITFDDVIDDGVLFDFAVSHPDIVQVLNWTMTAPAGERAAIRFWSSTQRAFAITTNPVSSDVAVTITARACCGAVGEVAATLTVTADAPPPPDVVGVTRARWRDGGTGGTLTVTATSTSGTALLTVYIAGTDRLLMALRPVGDGVYEGQQSFGGGMTNPGDIDVRSNLGGTATSRVR